MIRGQVCMNSLKIGEITLTWLNGGITKMDGGAIFGVVPKPLWSKKYESNELNQVTIPSDPMFLEWAGKRILIDAGIGNGKLSEKQLRNYGVDEESFLERDLEALGVSPEEIDYVLMTHMHFDHACGLSKLDNGKLVSVFPNAEIITSKTEWQEMKNPNIRSRNTYWEQNWQPIEDQVKTYDNEWSMGPLKLIHTGGHSDGHAILLIEDGGETAIHLADLLPTHAHQNVLWVTAYDDYPMTSIAEKQKWIKWGVDNNAWFTFYHDAIYRSIKWNDKGEITEAKKRE